MSIKSLAALFALVPLAAFAQNSPAPSPTASAPPLTTPASATAMIGLPPAAAAPEGAELTKLLNDFLAGASRNDAAIHERFWADDLVYTRAVGVRIGKAELMREVRSENAAPAPTDDTTIYTAEEVRIQQYGTTAIVAFRLVGTTKKGGNTEVANYLNTGTFLKRDGKWQAVSWQATKMGDAEKM